MRNLVALRDSLSFIEGCESSAVAVDFNAGTGGLLVLTRSGQVRIYDIESEEAAGEGQSWDLSMCGDNGVDHTWFDLVSLRGNGSIVCLSRAGLIISIPLDLAHGTWSQEVIVEGDVDGGIADAAWSPDQSRVVIVTNNDTILSMNSDWDVLEEVPLVEPRVPGTSLQLSWRGSGEHFALQSVDSSTGLSSIRVYSNELELLSTGRNIADGPASVLKGVGCCVAFCTNGALVAFPQERIKGKLQVAFIEKNGLRHREFDLILPDLPNGYAKWCVTGLQWDLPSALLAVESRALRDDESTAGEKGEPSVVQMYYRSNYHWYLKQQWVGSDLRILRFDSELNSRCYLTQNMMPRGRPSSIPAVRVVDLSWDVVCSNTRDASVAVADGKTLLMTPLGWTTVPPPMSLSTVTLPAVHKYSSFWTAPTNTGDKSGFGSGLVVLSEGLRAKALDGVWVQYHLSFFFLDARGNELAHKTRHVTLPSKTEECCVYYRAVLALPTSTSTELACVMLGDSERGEALTHADVPVSGEVPVLSSVESECKVTLHQSICPLGVKSQKLAHADFKDNVPCFALMSNRDGNCEIKSFRVEGNLRSTSASIDQDGSHLLPEDCVTITLLSVDLPVVTAAETGVSVPLCIGLSSRHRLYCGEMILASGVGSYAVNEGMGVLLYVTIGTNPHLHFISLRALAALDPDRDIDQEEGAFQLLEFAQARPVERGAKIICSVPSDSKVVVQQPRGNLEAFEPRPLVLSCARQLIDDARGGRYVECLKLLRRQRVDLNFLVDYNPRRFVHFAGSFMRECVESNDTKTVDMACLWISTLEHGNASLNKYPTPIIQRLLALSNAEEKLDDVSEDTIAQMDAVEGITQYLESDTGVGKVNVLCEVLRAVLQCLLSEGLRGSLRPLLCTLAKQEPPKLVEALDVIRSSCSNSSLSSSKVQGLIRYLVFLADSEQIFNAALASCDFEMSRAIARQCQMDPKAYLPMLEGFQAIGDQGDGRPGSYEHWVMHVAVGLHLKRPEMVIECGIKALAAGGQEQDTPSSSDSSCVVMSQTGVGKEVLSATNQTGGYALTLSMLQSAVATANKDKNMVKTKVVLLSVLSSLRYDYALHLRKQRDPPLSQVVALLLHVEPPKVKEAIDISVEMGDLHQALFLSSMYCKNSATPDVPAPVVLARTIVSAYETGLTGSPSVLEVALEAALHDDDKSDNGISEARQIAQICLDYCENDVENAVAILLRNRELLIAAHIAMRHGRRDLLDDDVNSSVKGAAYEFIVGLQQMEGAIKDCVQVLQGVWKDPEKRLAETRASDDAVEKELAWLESGGDADEYDPSHTEGGDVDDTKSEFSMASMRSDLSFVSGVSSVLSELSGLSSRSTSSRISKAGSATVSVLSEMKIDKKGSREDESNASSFAIKGIEHSLLSRGTGLHDNSRGKGAWDGGEDDRQLSKRQLRRKYREQNKPSSSLYKDTLGLGREVRACEELWRLAHVSHIALKCEELCKVLLLAGGAQGTVLAARVQYAMDSYTETLRSHPPIVAPAYPRHWLASKDMSIIRRFQETGLHDGATVGASGVIKNQHKSKEAVSFWSLAAEGISSWHARYRLAVLADCDAGEDDDVMALLAASAAVGGDY